MAIIGTIRNRFGWLLLIFMVLVLLLFVGSSAIENINSIFGGGNQNVGEIAGKSVSIKDFEQEYNKLEEMYKVQLQQQGRTSLNDQETASLREQAWNNFIQKIAAQKEYDKLGMVVTDEELEDLVQGNNIHPFIKQNFSNPQTGQFDKSSVVNFLAKFDSLPPMTQRIWDNFEENLPADRLRTKHENMLKLSLFVTTAEARREYEAQTGKANVKYLFIPFSSILDTTVKVTDEELKNEYNKNKNRYPSRETRNLQYLTFPVLPSAQDSLTLWEDIKKLARGLATTQDDSLFVKANSDVDFPFAYQSAYQLPKYLQDTVAYFFKGKIVGPYREGSLYSIFKIIDVKDDSIPSVRASHILFKADSSQASKTEALSKARSVLADIKSGKIAFENAARQYGSDGTAQQGGDLGWFAKNGSMVKPFQDAVFNHPQVGLLDNPVETQFGYHIIKTTAPQARTKYRIAGIQKNIIPSETTRESVFKKADQFAGQNNTVEELKAAVRKEPTLSLLPADKIEPNAQSVNTLQNAREIVRWAFNDAKVGEVSKQVNELENQFVVAALTGKTTADENNFEPFREQITFQVRKEKKAKEILAKIKDKKGTLEEVAKAYGITAQVNSAADVLLSGSSLANAGFEPAVIGRIFGLKAGQRSQPFEGEGGVFVVEATQLTPAATIADYSQYKNQLLQMYQSRTGYFANEVIKENAKIKDFRYKFY
jgi:peptidyl-prolyl cis-trans isomerase D